MKCKYYVVVGGGVKVPEDVCSLFTKKDKQEGLIKASSKSQKDEIGDWFTEKDKKRGLW